MKISDLNEGTKAAIKVLSEHVDKILPDISATDRQQFVAAIVVLIDHYALETAKLEHDNDDLQHLKVGGSC